MMKLLIAILFSSVCQAQTVNDLRPTVTMKEYVDAQIQWSLKLSEVQNDNIRDNVNKANSTMDRRLDGMNEFRDALKDSNKTYITKSELIGWIVAAISMFWGWSKHIREKKLAEGNTTKAIHSGDKVEVTK